MEDLDVSFNDSDDENNSELRKGLKELGLLGESSESPVSKRPPPAKSGKRPPAMKKTQKRPMMNESVSISDMDFDDIDDIKKKTPVKSDPAKSLQPEKPEKPADKPQPKPKQDTASKPEVQEKRGPGNRKRPPKIQPITIADLGMEPPKKPLTFDYLLEENDRPKAPESPRSPVKASSPPITPPVTPPSKPPSGRPSRVFSPIHKPSYEFPIESRIDDYLRSSIRAMITDVTVEITTMLQNSLDIGEIANEFIAEMRKTIRQAIDLQQEHTDYTRVAHTALDPYASGFIDTMTKIQKLKPKDEIDSLTSIQTARATIASRVPSIQDDLNSCIVNLSQEISDLQNMRSQINTRIANLDQRHETVMRHLTDLEVREISQRAENELLEMKKSRYEDSYALSEPVQADAPRVNSRVKSLIKHLQESDTAPAQSLKRLALRLSDMTEELKTMRQNYEFQHGQLCERCNALSSLTKYQSMMASQPVKESVVDEFPVPESSKTEVSVVNMKTRLEQVQKSRQDLLQSVSSIIEDAKRRTHHHHKSRSSRRREHV